MRSKKLITITAGAGSIAVVVGVVLAVTLSSGGHKAAASPNVLELAKSATASYQNIDTAIADGYTKLTDAKGIACIDNPGVGGMGIHYVKGVFVADPSEVEMTPELLVYAPQASGKLKLVAVEYVVLKSAWEQAGNTTPPSLFGHQFELVQAGNRYGLPAFYELHNWLWETNPRGQFDDWNPNVTCPAAQTVVSHSLPHGV